MKSLARTFLGLALLSGIPIVQPAVGDPMRPYSIRIDLRNTLAEAQAAEKRGALTESARLYIEALSLAHESEGGVDTEQRLALEGNTRVAAILNQQVRPVHISNERLAIHRKLDGIRLDNVQYDSLPLEQVIEALSRDAKNRDSTKKGLNFILSPNVDPPLAPPVAVDPVTGLPAPSAEAEAVDLAGITVRIMPAISDVTLRQALDAIVKVADSPIKYSIEDYAIVFSRRVAEPPMLHTRWFHIDPNTFLQGGSTFFDFGTGGGGGGGCGNQGGQGGQRRGVEFVGADLAAGQPGQSSVVRGNGIDHVTYVTRSDQIILAARQLFTAAGLDFTQPGKLLFFNNRLGLLMVRTTLGELDLIEQLMNVQNIDTAQGRSDGRVDPRSQEITGLLSISNRIANVSNTSQPNKRPVLSAQSTVLPSPETSRPSSLNSYTAWAQNLPEGRRGLGDDSNGNGIPNLIEYAWGTNINRGALVLGTTSLPDGTVSIRLQFELPLLDRPDVRWSVEGSPDLISWQTLATRSATGAWSDLKPGDTVTETLQSETRNVNLSHMENHDRYFMRLKAILPAPNK